MEWIIAIILAFIVFVVIKSIVMVIKNIVKMIGKAQYKKLEKSVLSDLGFDWEAISCFDSYIDEHVTVKSRQALEKYNEMKFFKENKKGLENAETAIEWKEEMAGILKEFLKNNKYKSHSQYKRLVKHINDFLKNAEAFRIEVRYISSAGNLLGSKEIIIDRRVIKRYKNDPSLLMGKGEYNKYLRDQQKEALSQKQHEYYEAVNSIIDYANANRESLVIEGRKEELDGLIGQLFDRTIHNIKKIKSPDSEEWTLIGNFMLHIKAKIEEIVSLNRQILEYYESSGFLRVKESCKVLMSSQREFNEDINEKVQSISQFFGSRVVRDETIHDDEYNYIRPYKKTITPFTAEVSAAVFASAENNPLEYIVKYFYPSKRLYPKQIRKLYRLVEELETLRDAKQIIENYKAEYQQYLGDVPRFVMENDEAGFYSRLGFATIDESVLTVEYKFSYTSGGGMAQRSFTVPMTEETIAELIKVLESKLTATAFAKEQRTLMTKKLREFIKSRDNFTCCNCGNSVYIEPNLLLEIDHIIPVAKGGRTVEDNLQTLCWKCNRAKSDKMIN